MGSKIVAIRPHGRGSLRYRAIGEFSNGYKAVQGVEKFTDSLRESHRYIPWANDFELIVTGRLANVQFGRGVLSGEISVDAVEQAVGRKVYST